MKTDYDIAADLMEQTIEDLAEDYGLPQLVELYEQKERAALVMSFTGLSIDALGIEDKDLSVMFIRREDLEDPYNGGVTSGFMLVLADLETQQSYLRSYHAESPAGSGQFNISGGDGGDLNTDLEDLQVLIGGGAPEVMMLLTRQEFDPGAVTRKENLTLN